MTLNPTRQHAGEVALAPAVLDELAAVFNIGTITAHRYVPTGLMNRNWRLEADAGVFALKEFRVASRTDVRRNLAVAAQLGRRGLPVPAPRPATGGGLVATAAGSEWCLLPWAAGEHKSGTALTADQTRQLGGILGMIHEGLKAVASPPQPGRTRQQATTAAKARATLERFAHQIADRPARDQFDAAAAQIIAQRLVLIDRFAGQAPPAPGADEPYGWTHGDFHPLNVLWDAGRVTAVLDWDRVKPQFLADEVARAASLHCQNGSSGLDLEAIAAFADGYRAETGTAAPLAAAADRLWWKRLTDAWQLIFHYDRNDTSCDHLLLEGEPVLSWWCADRVTVRDAFYGGA